MYWFWLAVFLSITLSELLRHDASGNLLSKLSIWLLSLSLAVSRDKGKENIQPSTKLTKPDRLVLTTPAAKLNLLKESNSINLVSLNIRTHKWCVYVHALIHMCIYVHKYEHTCTVVHTYGTYSMNVHMCSCVRAHACVYVTYVCMPVIPTCVWTRVVCVVRVCMCTCRCALVVCVCVNASVCAWMCVGMCVHCLLSNVLSP